ncbi:hypothetical protein [Alkalibacterium sp. 20]|uniref:hypothetical protein n=1 Tax=Alkalibacterium sp. 20 TaxID=1798803 RepID=UPI0009003A23|nr:hypothetical protein [Alkalibacterium sp. 20]OJF93061.1 hypothetical protein AX762_02280 [Alkalibacterium sp. 20]
MSQKSKRRLLQLFGFIIGLLFGYFRRSQMQALLPVLAIGVGIGYFIFSTIISDKEKSVDDVGWFPFVQMIMYFIIGGVLSSNVLLALELLLQ